MAHDGLTDAQVAALRALRDNPGDYHQMPSGSIRHTRDIGRTARVIRRVTAEALVRAGLAGWEHKPLPGMPLGDLGALLLTPAGREALEAYRPPATGKPHV
jgi:hypothetical protein